jgi:hypothetical protein
MLDTLVALALAHGLSALANHLGASIRQHGRPLLTAATLRMVTEAATGRGAAAPRSDYQPQWWDALRKGCKPNGEMLLVADATQDVYGTRPHGPTKS